MTSETDNKVEAAVSLPGSTDWWTVRRVANGDERCPWYELSREDIAALAAEVEHWKRLEKTADDLAWHNASKLAKVEAKLSALVEAAKPFARWIESARGAPWRAGPVLTANGGAVITVADFDAIRQALASLDRTAPESAEPAQEVAGLVEKVARIIDADAFRSVDEHLELARSQSRRFSLSGAGNGEIALANMRGLEPRRDAALKTAKRILTVLASSPSQGGEKL